MIRFVFPKQIGRVEYLVRLLGCALIVGWLCVSRVSTEPTIALVILVIWLYAVFFVLWPRLRHCGMTGMWVLLSLVPLIYVGLSIVLVFREQKFSFDNPGGQPPQMT